MIIYVVYNTSEDMDEFEGTLIECEDFIANYGAGWCTLTIMPKKLAVMADEIRKINAP